MALTIGQIEAACQKYLFTGRDYVDQTFADNFVVDNLLKKLVSKHSGGEKISETLRYGKMPVQAYTRGDTINRAYQDMLTRADFDWKFYSVPGVLYDSDLKVAEDSPQTIVSITEALEDNMMLSMGEQLEKDFYDNGTGSGGKVLTGIEAMFDQTTAAYGGISSADMPDWKAEYEGSFGNINASGKLMELVQDILLMKKKPTICLTSVVRFMDFWNFAYNKTSVQDYVQKRSGTKRSEDLINLGVENVSLIGIPIVGDRYLDTKGDTDVLYFLNENYLDFVANPKQWFSPMDPSGKFRLMENSHTWFIDYGVSLQMVTKRRNVHRKVDGVTNA